jgi:hypothetical protein
MLEENKAAESVVRIPSDHLMLLNSLATNESSRSVLLGIKAPIRIVELLKS